MESVEEEVFEVQTLQPFHGWAFERFCDRSGNAFPALTAAARPRAARDDLLNAVTTADGGGSSDLELEVGALPSAEWMWSHEWLPDVEYTQCDEEGWSYGSTLARINRRLAEGTSKVKREYYHFVRRRRWIRTRVKKPPAPATSRRAAVLDAAASRSQSRSRSSSSSSSSSESDAASSSRKPSDAVVPATTPKRYYRVYRDSVLAHFRFRSTPRLSNFVKVEYAAEDIQLEGWLGQRGTFSRGWKLRYFLLRLDRSSLVCLRDRASLVQLCEEVIDRHTSVTVEESANPQQFQFLVLNRERQLRLNAVDAATRAAWLSAISELIVRSRASFFAGDESEGNLSVRSRTFRRMQHTSVDYDDETSGYFGSMGHRVTTGNGGPSGGGGGPSGGGVVTKKTRRRAWRPYKLLSATMHSRFDTDRLRRFDYFERFRKDLRRALAAAEAFVTSNIDILEENLEAAEQLLSSAVAGVPKEDIAALRLEVAQSLRAFEDAAGAALEHAHANVLSCNRLARDLYLLARRLNERTLSFAPPPAQATVKKVIVESPAKRRIPEDWFIEPRDYDKRPSATGSVPESLPPPPSTSSLSRSLVVGSATAKPLADRTALSKSLTELKTAMTTTTTTGRRLSITDPSSSSRASVTSALSGSEPIRIKPYVEIPSALCDGHFELPSGVNDFVIKVHEKDLGALIGFTLCSKEYVKELESHFANALDVAHEFAAEERDSFKQVAPGAKSHHSFISTRLSATKAELYLSKLRSNDVQHTDMKFSYESGSSTHSIRCVTFFAAQFHAMRALTEPGNLQFLNSIAESRRWDATGGKSGAFFSMTHDKRYVLKGISLTEFNMFLHMAPHYFKFMSHVLELQSPTVMAKILGVFKLTQSRRLHKQATYVVVMENLSFGRAPGQMYDIKGILRRRYDHSDSDSASDDDREDADASARFQGSVASTNAHVAVKLPVLLDGNLAERIPIPVSQSDLDVLNQAIQNDTAFLCRAGVIDYSILMLFDEERREVVFGLIDYLHQFDFLKKMESTSKAGLTFRNPTVISPVSYRRRFVNAMHRYLVGIEEELELRMRKRGYASTARRADGAGAGALALPAPKTKSSDDGDSSDSRRAHRRLQRANGVESPQRASMAGAENCCVDVATAASRASTGSLLEQASMERRKANASLELVVSSTRARGHSFSHVALEAPSFDRVGGKAHSDGEEFSSTSSDDNCLKGSQAVLDSMLPEFDD
ncbi:hypothetical protein PybrP1_009106 [[Pythium] brassicae (nom. inval.)]|nr:hypothetical protein PybrP1_009106 [[Pythium] brassicae (nom. inval.)]